MTAIVPVLVDAPLLIKREASDRSRASSTLTLTTLTATMWIGVAVQKIALPGNIELTFVVMAGAIVFLMIMGRARLSLPRMLVFALLTIAIATGQAVAADQRSASIPAICMTLALYALFLFVVPIDDGQRETLVRRFQSLALTVAGLVGIQWAFQLAGLSMPSLESIIPPSMLFQSYNYIQPLTWQAAYMKPNGIFMLEASHTSQLLAMAVIVEICLFHRWWRVAALLVAQLSTFGGTGFVLLLAGLLVVPFYLRGKAVAALIALAVLIAAGTSFTPVWDNFAKRSGEIGGEDSTSGRGRFIEPYLFMANRLAANRQTLISGIAPGNGKLDLEGSGQLVLNPMVKAIVEYGMLAGVLWMLFIHGCVLRTRMPFVVAFVVIVQYDFLNGALLVPLHLLYCWVLAGAHSRGNAE